MPRYYAFSGFELSKAKKRCNGRVLISMDIRYLDKRQAKSRKSLRHKVVSIPNGVYSKLECVG